MILFESFAFNDMNVYIPLAFVTAKEKKQVWARIKNLKKHRGPFYYDMIRVQIGNPSERKKFSITQEKL